MQRDRDAQERSSWSARKFFGIAGKELWDRRKEALGSQEMSSWIAGKIAIWVGENCHRIVRNVIGVAFGGLASFRKLAKGAKAG